MLSLTSRSILTEDYRSPSCCPGDIGDLTLLDFKGSGEVTLPPLEVRGRYFVVELCGGLISFYFLYGLALDDRGSLFLEPEWDFWGYFLSSTRLILFSFTAAVLGLDTLSTCSFSVFYYYGRSSLIVEICDFLIAGGATLSRLTSDMI